MACIINCIESRIVMKFNKKVNLSINLPPVTSLLLTSYVIIWIAFLLQAYLIFAPNFFHGREESTSLWNHFLVAIISLFLIRKQQLFTRTCFFCIVWYPCFACW